MKKIKMLPVLLLAIAPEAMAQCEDPTELPYMADIETVFTPSLPQCMTTMWDSFASQEVFESSGIPVTGLTGNVLAYDTTINTKFGMPPNAWIRSSLALPKFQMEQGMAYTVSFRYANSEPNLIIGGLTVYLDNTQIGGLVNITGATAANYVTADFTPATTGEHYIFLTVESEGTQGQLFIDDIEVKSTGVMGTKDKAISGLSIYPNPARSMVTLSNNAVIDSVEMYSTTGQLVLAERPNTLSSDINLGALSSGIYIAHIRSGSQFKKARIIKE
jgi:Secretion system C-terminal sorting domain